MFDNEKIETKARWICFGIPMICGRRQRTFLASTSVIFCLLVRICFKGKNPTSLVGLPVSPFPCLYCEASEIRKRLGSPFKDPDTMLDLTVQLLNGRFHAIHLSYNSMIASKTGDSHFARNGDSIPLLSQAMQDEKNCY